MVTTHHSRHAKSVPIDPACDPLLGQSAMGQGSRVVGQLLGRRTRCAAKTRRVSLGARCLFVFSLNLLFRATPHPGSFFLLHLCFDSFAVFESLIILPREKPLLLSVGGSLWVLALVRLADSLTNPCIGL